MGVRTWFPNRHTLIRSHVRRVSHSVRVQLVDRLTGDAMVLKNLDAPITVDLSGGDSYLLGRNQFDTIRVIATAEDPAHVNFAGAVTLSGSLDMHGASMRSVALAD